MNSTKVLKCGMAGLAIVGTMVACNPGAQAYRANSASSSAPKAEREAVTTYALANAALQKGDTAAALAHAERAVELSPRDLGYRMLLADLYLKSGRFQSAATTFEDVLALDPTNVRAGLSAALARTAIGQRGGAIAQLDQMHSAPAADLGLAYALAGDTARAIQLLEPAAREQGAQGRVRQNLALAYALAGDWTKARTTAAQDISPDQLNDRMQQWAALAQPAGPADQVAALFGVVPAAADEGQPVRLALAPPASDGTAFAAAEPAPQPISEAPVAIAAASDAAAPAVQTAEISDWVSAAAPEAIEPTQPVYAAAVQSLVTPQPAVIKASSVQPLVQRFEAPRAKPASQRPTGRFAVQIGAYSSPAAVQRAWASTNKRFGFTGQTPLSTVVKVGKGTFHRLSVAGFTSHGEAVRACQGIKAKGGACFVRTIAGDTPLRWASRQAGARQG